MNKILFTSLGCDKNTVDTEFMLGLLRDEGYTFVTDEEEADIIVINTCAFIEDAQAESINSILEAAELKKAGKIKRLVVTGCLAERYKEDILTEITEVDAVVGTTAIDRIVEAVRAEEPCVISEDINRLPLPETNRVCTTGGYYSYLKIAEGCDKHCTYCRIPSLRGSYRSIPMERLISEAEFLVEGGTKELILVAQETSMYGVDLYGRKRLHELIKALSDIPELKWIRIMYCYPEEIYEELILEIATNPKVCHYIDMPVQHGSDEILKRMGRKTSRKEIENIVKKLREEIPDIAIRTSIIAGFPGETEEDIDELLDFMQVCRFDRLGCFAYSKEQGTPASKYKLQIKKSDKNKRRNRVMKLQRDLSVSNEESKLGQILDVIIEGKLPEDNVWIGRSYMDAPGVDGYVFLSSEDSYMSGDIIKVKITDSKEYDLVGVAVTWE